MRVCVNVDDTVVEIETEAKYSPDVMDDLLRRATETLLNVYAGVNVIDESVAVMVGGEDEDEDEDEGEIDGE